MPRHLALLTTLLLGSLAGGSLWLVASESGLQAAAVLASQASGGRLHLDQVGGRLAGPLSIGELRWETPELQVSVQALHLDWSPGELLHGRLRIAELGAARLQVSSPPQAQPSPPPETLILPLAIAVEKITIDALGYGDAFTARQLAGRFASDGRQHSLEDFQGEAAGVALRARAMLDGAAPLRLVASGEIAGQLEQQPLALDLSAEGPLQRLALKAVARQGIEGSADVLLTPFAPAAFASARIALSNIDPAAWHSGAPRGRLDLRSELTPRDDGVAGSFSLSNRQPGPIDRQRLPFTALSGQLDWQGATATLTALRLDLSGKGRLTGQGNWQDNALTLALQASQLDAAQLLSTLQPTRLDGRISGTAGTDRQSLKLDLRDRRFSVLAEASHAAGRVSLPRLEIAAGPARLAAHGELALDQGMAFNASGELRSFDPARFAKAPAALINASFKASGKLQPRPVVDGSFALRDSRLAGQPLTGQGQLRIDWPRIPLADIRLSAGPNSLAAQGAYGRAGDSLGVVIDAPQLAPYGVDGGISGRLELTGVAQDTHLTARLQAASLGLPGLGRMRGLTLDAEAGGKIDSPLRVDLAVAQLDTPDQPGLAKALHIRATGSNRAHRLEADVDLPESDHLRLAADGGLSGLDASPAWRGRVLETRLTSKEKARNFSLSAPADLQLAGAAWSFGPARLAGAPLDWQATLQAAGDAHRLSASLSARGSRVGRVEGQFGAGLQGAWSLDRNAPWQGSLSTDTSDIAWLAELIGDGWQTGGRFKGELKLAGSPAQPLASGRFRGEQLAVRQSDQGLNLANGELSIDLDDNLLRVRQLRFDSLLQPTPRALRLAGRDDLAALTRQPGRLDVTGEMRIDRHTGADRAFLDFRLDRLGIFQLPDQWVLVSGDGRLTWQDTTFGARGKLAVDAGYWQLAPSDAPRLSDDVVIRRPGSEKAASKLRPKLDLDIAADLGRNFLFKGAGLSTRLSGDLRLRASGHDLPRATGSIRTREGRFDAYGQQLAIERGILSFQGLLDNPALDVRAVRKGLAVEAGVQIGGTAQRPVVKLVSDPELPDAEKLSWLVLGHGPEQMGAGDAAVLLAAAPGLLGNNSGKLLTQLKGTFGIDEFGVRQGDIGGSGGRQPSSRIAGSSYDTTAATGSQIFSVGKRLSSNALLSYEQALGKAESIVKLTVNLTRQVSVVGRAGSDNALDIFYTLSFGRETRRPRGK